MNRDAVLDAVFYIESVFEPPKGAKTYVGKFGDWTATQHFAVKFTDYPKRMVSKWTDARTAKLSAMLDGWMSGEHRVPLTEDGREYLCNRYVDADGRVTYVQDVYTKLLDGLELVRYDGPGFDGVPVLGLRDGEPVVAVMEWQPPSWRMTPSPTPGARGSASSNPQGTDTTESR